MLLSGSRRQALVNIVRAHAYFVWLSKRRAVNEGSGNAPSSAGRARVCMPAIPGAKRQEHWAESALSKDRRGDVGAAEATR